MSASTWLQLGPVAVAVDTPPIPLPSEWFAVVRDAPAPWTVVQRSIVWRRRAAGEDGPVRRTDGGYLGPGFSLACDEDRHTVVAADPVSFGGALCAALVDVGPRAGALLLHASGVLFAGRAVLFLGASGTGKSTLARQHAHRAFAANAIVVWRDDGRWVASGLPFTGRGDAAVRVGVFPLLGGFFLASTRSLPIVALAACTASAIGRGPDLDLVVKLATECAFRPRNPLDRAARNDAPQGGHTPRRSEP